MLLPQPPQVFSNQWFEALFPPALEVWVVWSVAGSTSCSFAHPAPQSATSLGPPAPALLRVLSAPLPVSAAPTSLDECFFFNSLVVGLPYSSVFCQFLLFLFLKCCCPSFGCARRHSVSTYASIMAGSQIFKILLLSNGGTQVSAGTPFPVTGFSLKGAILIFSSMGSLGSVIFLELSECIWWERRRR